MLALGYEPNFQASNLANQNSKTIGIILPPTSDRETFENPFFLETIRGISLFCNGRQYISTIVSGQNSEELLGSIRTMVRSGQADGFILLYSKTDDAIIEYLNEEGLLYVLIGKAQQFANLTIYIDNDNVLAGKEATDYLYDLGHRKIAYLGSESIKLFSADRKTGYQLSIMQHNLPVNKNYMIEVQDVYLDEREDLLAMLKSEDRPTAIVVSDDILAVSLERVCIQCGLSIPKDLSIISFNDSLFAKLTHPPLTSINVNSSQLGIEAASQLINHIENPNLVATKIIVPHSLVERESCCRID
jgi:DNA-binding LacI/PurR family transcriptional regulator